MFADLTKMVKIDADKIDETRSTYLSLIFSLLNLERTRSGIFENYNSPTLLLSRKTVVKLRSKLRVEKVGSNVIHLRWEQEDQFAQYIARVYTK